MTIDEMQNKIASILGKMGEGRLLEYLNDSDFWTAPASTKYHGAEKGGLAKHSYQVAINAYKISEALDIESPIGDKLAFSMILGICHDLCKVNFYKEDTKNIKDVNGNWTKVPCYSVRDDHTSYGHGMTSYIRTSELIKNKSLLKQIEIPIIYHMGNYDLGEQSVYGYGKAKNDFPWLSVLQCADQLAAAVNKS